MACKNGSQYQRNRRNLIKRNLLKHNKYKCEYCENDMQFDNPQLPNYVTIDHKLPLSKGGSNRIDNLAVCCRSCNFSKASLTLEQFFQKKQEAC
jgi:5-methylcytosine-specific restriction endonuclease McrA